MNNIFNEIENEVEKADKILLSSHLSPDGDNLGSLIGLGLSLEKMGKEVTLLQLDEIPKYLKFLKGLDKMTDKIPDNIDLYITVDCANKERLGDVEILFNDPTIKIINIDHHKSNEYYGDINLVIGDYSSTCEIVYELIKHGKFPLPTSSMDSLYTGICTDTGRFLYPAATDSTLKAASELIECGADKRRIMYYLYENESIESKRLKIEILSKSEFYFDNKLVLSSVTLKQASDYNSTISEVDEVVNEYKNVGGVELSVLIKEKIQNEFKMSLRSKTYHDVSKFAADFGGGGHTFAAGCSIKGSLIEVKNKLLERFEEIEWKS